MSLIAAYFAFVGGAMLLNDVTVVAAGLAVAQGEIPWWIAIAGCATGTFLGDVLQIMAGRLFGWTMFDRVLRLYKNDRLSLLRWKHWIEAHSGKAAFIACFLPGIRTPVQLLIGIVCERPIRLIVPLILAALIYASVTIGIAWFATVWSIPLVINAGWGTGPWIIGVGVILWLFIRSVGWIFARIARSNESDPLSKSDILAAPLTADPFPPSKPE